MAEEEQEWAKLPLEDRTQHKAWKARVSGYEEAIKKFPTWDSDDAAQWKKLNGQIKKFITDSNAIAQEKGLEAALLYVENCDGAGRVCSDCIEGIVTKCLGAPKAKTKDLAAQIVLMFVEIEQQEKVIEELIKGLAQKNPKVVAGCVTNLKNCLHSFGAKVIKVSPLLKAVVPLLDHRDKVVREEGKQLIIESYRWIGDMMKQQLGSLKPVQLSELEAEFEKVEGKAKPERLLRSQQVPGGGGGGDGEDGDGEGGGEDGEGGDDGDDAADDPYDLMDPVNILDGLPKDFYEKVEEKKWQLRGEALDALLELVKAPKIASGDYADLTRVLKKFISKDSNVMLVTKAAQATAGLAKGLRQNFKNGSAQLLPAVLEKFKEKKANVVAALQEAADALGGVIGVEAIQEDTLVTLKHKTPSVVTETAKFLARCFAKCPGALVTNKKMVKGYVSALVERLSHADANVRDGSSEALGVLMKVLGEPTITKLMPDVDAIKVAKVKEFMEKAELTGKLPKAEKPAAPPAGESGGPKKVLTGGAKKAAATGSGAKKPGSAPARKTTAPAVKKSPPREPSPEPEPAPKPERKTTAAGKKTSVASKKKDADVDLSPPYVANDLKKTRFRDESKLKVLKWNFTTPRQEFVDQLKEQVEAAGFNTSLQTMMFHSDFKQHLKAIDMLAKHLPSDVTGVMSNLDLIFKWVTLRFFETNPSVLLKSLEYLNEVFNALAEQSFQMHDLEAVCFIPYLVNKVGDPKDQVRAGIKTMFKSIYQVYPASKFAPFLMDGIKHKNAKQRTECLDELGWMIRNHGMTVLQQPAACLKEMAKSISDRDNSVRNGALNAITEAYFQVGEKMYKMVGHLPEKDMAMLEERIKRVSKTRGPPVPNQPPQQPAQQQHPASNGHGQGAGSGGMQPSSPERPQTAGGSGIPGPKASTGLPGPRTIKNFRQLQPPGGGPPLNIPPASTGGPITTTTVPLEGQGVGGFQRRTSPGSADGPRARPISGAFSLDIDKIEGRSGGGAGQGGRSALMSRLVNHDNLDDILNGDPVVLPPTATSARYQSGVPVRSNSLQSPERVHHPHSDALTSPVGGGHSNNLTNNAEAKEALDVVLAQVFNTNQTVCLSALGQLDELFKDKDKWVLMSDQVDQLLTACYMQYRNVLNSKIGEEEGGSGSSLKLMNYIAAVLLSMYHHIDLAKRASSPRLYDLLQVIISILLDPKLASLKNGSGLLRALNVLTVKILDRSDPTAVTCAFVKLLHNVVGNSEPPKHVELVMKCLWKVIRLLPKWIEDNRVDLDVVLGELHSFLKDFPTSYWRKQEIDTPMRTVKTMLHAMVQSRRDAILDNLTKVPDTNGSELVPYLKKLLNSGVGGKENQNNGQSVPKTPAPNNNNNIAPTTGSGWGDTATKLPRFSKSDHDQLAEIFRKIGDKEHTKVGLQELKNFQAVNPHADLEPFLAKSSPYFRKYIERGLASIEANSAGNGGLGLTGNSEVPVLAEANRVPVVTGGDGNTPSAFMSKLKALREKAGLESHNPYGSSGSSLSGVGGGGGTTSTSSGFSSAASSAASATNMYRISNFASESASVHTHDDYSSSSGGSTLVGSSAPPSEAPSDQPQSDPGAGMDDIRRRFERVKMNSAF